MLGIAGESFNQYFRGLYMSSENRRFTRIPFHVNAEITAHNVSYAVDKISNLSIGGCLLPMTAGLAPGTVCRLKIGLSGTSSELDVTVNGTIKRCDAETAAVECTDIDPDSLFHLKNILRYNFLGDEDIIDRENRKHPGIR